jgi:hypothetical protein
MSDDNNNGLPAGAVVGPPLRQQSTGLPNGAVVGPPLQRTSDLPNGAVIGPALSPTEKSDSKQGNETPVLGKVLNVAGEVAGPAISLYHGLMGHEETPEEKGTRLTPKSPVVQNLGFTPKHMAYSVGELVRGAAAPVHDIVSTKMPVIEPDEPGVPWSSPKAQTIVGKYITAPSEEERQEALAEAQKFHDTHGAEAFGHLLNTYIHTAGELVPFVGPLVGSLTKKAESGDVGGALSQVAALYGAAKLGPKALDKSAELTKTVAERTPVIRGLVSGVTTDRYQLGRDVVKAQSVFDEAKADFDKYKDSTKQGINPPKNVVDAYNKAADDLAIAKAHHEMASTLPQVAGGKVGRALRTILPTPTEIPTEDITARPATARVRTEEPSFKPMVSEPEPVTMQPLGQKSPRAVVPQEPGLVGSAYTEPKAAAVEAKVEGPDFKKMVDDIGEQVRVATGGAEPLKANVPLREQVVPEQTEPVKYSSEPRKAALQKAGATDEEIDTILPKGAKPGQTGLTRVEMSQLADSLGVDLGDKAIGRAKADLKAGTHLTQEQVLQRMLEDHSPAEIAEAISAGRHLPTISGGSQAAVDISPNASGESTASQEAVNRTASEKNKGTKYYRLDTRSGKATPLLGVDRVDATAGDYDEIVKVDKDGTETTLDKGSKARPRLRSSRLYLQ